MKKIFGLIMVLSIVSMSSMGCFNDRHSSLDSLLTYWLTTDWTWGCDPGWSSCGNGRCCPDGWWYNVENGTCYLDPTGSGHFCNASLNEVMYTADEVLPPPKQGDAVSSIQGTQSEKATKIPKKEEQNIDVEK